MCSSPARAAVPALFACFSLAVTTDGQAQPRFTLGRIVTLALASTGGFSANPGSSGSATLTLIGPDGVVLAGLRSNSLTSFTLPASGTYVLQISATNLATIGSYNVSLHCLLPTPTPAPALPCGPLQSGTLAAAGDLDLYSFNGAAGQIVTLALASTGGFSANPGSSGSATVTLFAPSGMVVGAFALEQPEQLHAASDRHLRTSRSGDQPGHSRYLQPQPAVPAACANAGGAAFGAGRMLARWRRPRTSICTRSTVLSVR